MSLLDLPDDLLVEIFSAVDGEGDTALRRNHSPTPLARLACVSRRLRALVDERCWQLKASRGFRKGCVPRDAFLV